MNKYQLRQGEKAYIFTSSTLENSIRLSCKNASGKVFSRDVSISDLKSIDPFFNLIKTEKEAVEYIDKALNVHKVGVSEENGIIKIIFYITTEGIIHTVEFPLGEGKSLLQSKLINSTNEKGLELSEQAIESSQPIEVSPQTYATGEINSYEQQSSFLPPTITPVEEDTTSGDNLNVNEYMSQIQTSNVGESYDTYQTQNYTEANETNVENIGSFIMKDNNQFAQNEATNIDFEGVNMAESSPEVNVNQYVQSNEATDIGFEGVNMPESSEVNANQYIQSNEAKNIDFEGANMPESSPEINVNQYIQSNETTNIDFGGVNMPESSPEINVNQYIQSNEATNINFEGVNMAESSEVNVNQYVQSNEATNIDFEGVNMPESSPEVNVNQYIQSNETTDIGFEGVNMPESSPEINVNQYNQSNETTNIDFGGVNMPESSPLGNEYNLKTYEFTSNQNVTTIDNNYMAENNNVTTYQESSTSYEANSSNIQTNYENIISQYDQSNQQMKDYQTTASVEKYDNTLPTITPVEEDIETNKVMVNTSKYQTYSTPVINSSLLLNQEVPKYETTTNIVSDTQYDQQLYSDQHIPETANNNYNNYFEQTTTTQTKQFNNLKQVLNPARENVQTSSGIDYLKVQNLKTQPVREDTLVELENLKKQVKEMNVLKTQLIGLNELRVKAAEFDSVKYQLYELNNLKQQLEQMNNLQKDVEEINELKVKVNENEDLKKRIEELEKEIEILKENKTSSEEKEKGEENKGLESKQLTVEEEPKQICVKGDIFHDTKELEMITKKINKLNKKLTLNLLYKATAESDKASTFHAKCDEAKCTVVLVETDKGKRFGGFTTCSWEGECIEKKDEEAFVFSLDKMKTYDNIPGEEAIGCYPKFGPVFMGCQIRIYDNAFTRGGTTFEKGLNYKTEEDFELNGGERTFIVKEIEVYEVIQQ